MVASPRLPGAWGLLLLLLAPGAAGGQQSLPVRGRVVLASADSAPVPGVRLVLHRVGRAAQGPLDSTVTGPDGSFRLRFAADTTSLYLLSASYAGIEYFSPPVNTNPALPDTALVVAVFDTSSTQPVTQVARYLVIRRAAEDGSRSVLDLIVLENRGAFTRLAGDTVRPSWQGFVPRGASGVRVGEADLSADAILIRGDTIEVFAPIAPGEKQIALEYALRPGLPLELEFGQDSVATNVLAQDPDARVEGGEMAAVDSQNIEGENFRRWVGAPHAGDAIKVSFGSAAGGVPGWILPAMVGMAALGLLAVFFLQRKRRATPHPLEAITDRIAELEARYAGREGEVPAQEWTGYLADRERLRASLAAHLASRGRAP